MEAGVCKKDCVVVRRAWTVMSPAVLLTNTVMTHGYGKHC
jgi:hypothetical protein